MRHAFACIHLVLASLLTMSTCAARAQQEPYVPVFDQLFKQPTGQNGYEDLVMAGDLIHHNLALEALQNGVSAAGLTAKRRALATQEARRALALIRSGLDKHILSPRDKIDYTTTLPEYPQFRALARLLMSEQYVLLAEGQTERAIQNLRDGLRLGQAARTDHLLISELVGIAIDRICIDALVKHLDQLSEHDCDSLLTLLEEWRGGERSAIPSLLRERDSALLALEEVRKKPESVLHDLFSVATGNDEPDESAQLAAMLIGYPGGVNQAVDEAAALIKQNCEALIASLQLPPWQRPEVKAPEGKSPGHQLCEFLAPNYDQVLSKFTLDDVNLQLFAVHVAICRYRWQYDRLPDRLEQLRLDTLIIDPFTGKPLVYQRRGESYDLSSAGGYDHDDNGARIPGKRMPVTLPH